MNTYDVLFTAGDLYGRVIRVTICAESLNDARNKAMAIAHNEGYSLERVSLREGGC